jgi:hypothetical protein
MNKYFFYSMLFLFAAVTGCKEDDEDQCCDPTNPECVNYDPCFGETETTAAFKFFARYGLGEDAEWVEETKFIGSPILFAAEDTTADSYTWYLGIDTFTNVTQVQRTISQLANGSYPASLVVEKTPNLDCFPLDDGRDSLYMEFEVVDRCEALTYGKFRGMRQGVDNDSIDIEIYLADFNTGEPCVENSTTFFVNCAGQNDTVAGSGIGTYSRTRFTSGGFGYPDGEIIVSADLSVEFDYEFFNINYSFRGRKIQ